MKKKEVILMLYSFTPSDVNFQTILMPKVILAKHFYLNASSMVEKFKFVRIDLSGTPCTMSLLA